MFVHSWNFFGLSYLGYFTMCNLTDLLVDEPSTVPPDAFPVWKEKKNASRASRDPSELGTMLFSLAY